VSTNQEIEEVSMKVWLDRDTCVSNMSACISCFGELMRRGAVDRGCILEVEEDDTEDITVYMRSDGEDRGPYVIPADQRELVAYEGWDKFVDFVPEFRKDEGATKGLKEKKSGE
jgi:hypothetical protein